MSKFNTKKTTKTINYAGGKAFLSSPKIEFASRVLTSFIEDKYYETASKEIEIIQTLIDKIEDKKFLAKTAIFARTKFGMRSVSHVVAAEIAKRVKGEKWTKHFFEKVVHRPDDITEILSYYLSFHGKPIPNSLKKGLSSAINKFDSHQIAKYKREKNKISFVDVFNLIHPKVKNELQMAAKALMKGKLFSENTWESELSKAGKIAKTPEEKSELKKRAWIKLIKEKKIGYFALLRNLRNILEQAPEIIDDAISILTDENMIKKSLVFPFRFYTAFEEIKKLESLEARKMLSGISIAAEISLSNVPEIKGRTLVALDGSGSMCGRPIIIGSLFAASLYKKNNCDFLTFSDDAKYFIYNPQDNVLSIAEEMMENTEGKGTNFHSIFLTANKAYDRIIILSDMQGWIGVDPPTKTFAEYKKRTNSNPIIYSFDLGGYGTLQFPEKDVYCFFGFSEKIFDIIKIIEYDKNAMISEIEAIEL